MTVPRRSGHDASSVMLFGGVHGAVVASAMVAALTEYGHNSAAAMLPGVLILAGAGWGWWPADGVEYPAFVLNIVLLFALGLVSARRAGRTWARAPVTGVADAMLGPSVVVANTLIK